MSVDVMIDLETTGVSAGCGILSIGAVTFSEEFKFYEKIDIKSCHNFGLRDSPGTMSWWHRQSAEARMEAFSGTTDLQIALGRFADFLTSVKRNNGGKDIFLWGNGADFDLPILKAAYIAVDMVEPWGSFNGRCYRTVKNLPENKLITADKFEGMKHSAIDDAIFQARHMMKILREGKKV